MGHEYVINIEQLGCKVGYRYLLKDINWKVNKGENWVVFGMNGSGKTTLLSIIAGYKHFTEGCVKLFGEEFSNENILKIRKRIGWVSSSFFDKFYSKESVLDIVLSGKNGALGLDSDIDLNDVIFAKDLLEHLGLFDKINRGFDMLSKGERQNVLIARAIFSKPEILILDEPCSGLDIYNRSYLFNTLNELSKQNNFSMIYVTHYVEEILPIFDHALLLKNGRIVAKGKTKDIFNSQAISQIVDYPIDIVQENDGMYHIDILTNSSLMEVISRGDQYDR